MFGKTKEKRYREEMEREARIRREYEEAERRRKEEEEERRKYEEFKKQQERETLRTKDPLDLIIDNYLQSKEILERVSTIEDEIIEMRERIDYLENCSDSTDNSYSSDNDLGYIESKLEGLDESIGSLQRSVEDLSWDLKYNN